LHRSDFIALDQSRILTLFVAWAQHNDNNCLRVAHRELTRVAMGESVVAA